MHIRRSSTFFLLFSVRINNNISVRSVRTWTRELQRKIGFVKEQKNVYDDFYFSLSVTSFIFSYFWKAKFFSSFCYFFFFLISNLLKVLKFFYLSCEIFILRRSLAMKITLSAKIMWRKMMKFIQVKKNHEWKRNHILRKYRHFFIDQKIRKKQGESKPKSCIIAIYPIPVFMRFHFHLCALKKLHYDEWIKKFIHTFSLSLSC